MAGPPWQAAGSWVREEWAAARRLAGHARRARSERACFAQVVTSRWRALALEEWLALFGNLRVELDGLVRLRFF